MNFAPYANYGYAGLIKESTEATPITPTNYFRLISETLSANFGNQDVNEIATDRERRRRSIQGQIEATGELVIMVEEKMIGHFLRSVYGAPTTQTVIASTSYRHVFEVTNAPKTYTLDLQRGDAPWVHRYFGLYFTQMNFARNDNGIQVTITCAPRKVFNDVLVMTAANSGTTLSVDQTSGLTTADTILVLQKEDGFTTVKELAITSIDSETQLTVSTIDVQIDKDDIVVIKSADVTESSYSQCDPFQFMNGTQFFIGNDIDNTAEITVEDYNITLANEVEPRFGSGGNEVNRYPYDVLVKGYTGEGQFTKYYDSEFFLSKLRKNTKFPFRILHNAQTAISANSAQKASSTFGATANGFKIEASAAGKAGNDLNVTILIADDDTLAASKSGNNITIRLANTTASKNTGTLIAAAVDALTGVDGTAEGTGAEQFTTAAPNVNLGFKSTGTNVVGADASQKPYLQIDLSHTILGEFAPNGSEDDIIPQEVPFTIFKDTDCDNDNRKNWSTRIYLFNSVASY